MKQYSNLTMKKYVSRAGEKLEFALDYFKIDVKGKVVADFGSSTGGFVGVLLKKGAKKVYSVDTAYGELDWNLRNDPRVVVLERTNAMHIDLTAASSEMLSATATPNVKPTSKAHRTAAAINSGLMDVITIDTGWTRQSKVLPNALRNLKNPPVGGGVIISLVKSHYEAGKNNLSDKEIEAVLDKFRHEVAEMNAKVVGIVESPVVGKRAGNKEYLALVKKL